MKLKDVENQIRNLVNWVAVKRQEEVQDVTSKIESQTADELVEKLKLQYEDMQQKWGL